MKNLILRNQVTIPEIGFGTWQTPDGDTAVNSVACAIESGYRHIDTAACYGNEVSVGKGIRKALETTGLKREDIFVTSKLWNANRGYETTLAAFDKTMADLGLEYLDLYLIHWPANGKQFANWDEINLATWKAMTELYKAGRIRAIGVSNFQEKHLRSLMETEVAPMVDQIEFHPGFLQNETVEYCKKNGLLVEAWSPLGMGRMLNDPTLAKIAQAHGKSVAQVCIRFCMQSGTLPLPKSVTPSRIKQNLEVFDFALTDADMETIRALPISGNSGWDSDMVDF